MFGRIEHTSSSPECAKSVDPIERLEAVRAWQLGLGDIHLDKGADRHFLGYVAQVSRSKLTQ